MAPFSTVGPVANQALLDSYRRRRVLVTGHTGFKGSWLTIWLASLGAEVTGLALPPDGERPLFDAAGVRGLCRNLEGDIRDAQTVRNAITTCRPEFVFHLAAQSLVRRGYKTPVDTFETNVMGTVHLLDAIRLADRPCAAVIVTSDKCYRIDDRRSPYGEEDVLGGRDPYSSSKAAAELATAAYRASFFAPEDLAKHGVAVATARSGNVIGGGDWSEDRLVPDAIRSLERREPIPVRQPKSVRPWQHVIDPLVGYLTLGSRLSAGSPAERAAYCSSWNFGPPHQSSRSVQDVVEEIIRTWGSGSWIDATDPSAPHEAAHLALSIDKAKLRLGWHPRWGFREAIDKTVAWYQRAGGEPGGAALAEFCREQIRRYLEKDA